MQPEKPTEQSPQNIEPVIKPVPVADTTDLFQPDPIVLAPASKRVPDKELLLVLGAIVVLIGFIGSMTFMMVRSKPTAGTSEQKDLIAQNSESEQQEADGESSGSTTDQTPSPSFPTTPSPVPSPTSPAPSPSPPPVPASKTYTISYTNACYSPANLTIKKGDTVKFINNSNKSMWPASDDHPAHDEYAEFDSRSGISQGGSYSFTFSRAGSWGYHDHNKPGCTGTVAVLN